MKLQHYEINAGVALCRATHGAFLVDVRTPGEFHSGHIPGSVNLPLERLETAPLPGGPLFVYCRSGQRSYYAVMALQNLGRKNIYNISGSFLGICLYEYYHDLAGNRKKIVTDYNFN